MMKKYNGLFIFSGSLKDEALDKTVGRATAEIERLGGKIDEIEVLGRKTFARQLKKCDNGVYVSVKFQLDTTKNDALRARYRLSEDVFRAQFLVRDERFEAALEADKARRAAHRATVEAATAAAGEKAEAAEPAAEADADAEQA